MQPVVYASGVDELVDGLYLQLRVLARSERRRGGTPDTFLSRVYQARGEMAASESLLRETLATAERLYDAPHDRIALALLNLGDALRAQARVDEAEPLLISALAMMRAIYGDGHLRVANTLNSLGALELRRHDLAAAARQVESALAWCRQPGRHATRSCIDIAITQTELALAAGDLALADTASARWPWRRRSFPRAINGWPC